MYPQLAIEAAAHSDVGRRRSHNEDSFAALPCVGLFMVADGLGGNAAGEVASRMAIEVVKSCFEEGEELEETWPYGTATPHDRDEVRLVLSVRRANRAIYEASQQQEVRGMATTFAGVLLGRGMAYIAHVGDSRVYRMRGGRLERLTRDHTLLEELLGDSDGAREAVEALSERASVVTRALGCEKSVDIESRVEATKPGDLFLVCSDGLWGPVPEARIEGVLGRHRDLSLAASLLVDIANENGGPDNVTCVLARLGGG
ncbi:PP2C family protein-serine/threonine phosphatase [Sorangium atrum]|uniref:Protein phosphatase 2C domain-containing protein n=1 Tax=Sorangium atrum TaxID=2995308 RepID=A0ABT5CD39_9BACT|nr:protein phosphatase 2C domain-containing protein [Sorangium aterium]MDC0684356.1 protein phosphatase 2C domain-containing protein [Sorangium aterium]